MKYKVLTIAVASLLPLGFAATASATNPTADHELTYTIAEERSISVAVKDDAAAVDFGTVAKGSETTITDAVTVTYSSPDLVNETVEVTITDKAGDASLPAGVTLTLQPDEQAPAGSPFTGSTLGPADITTGGLPDDPNEFDIDMKLVTTSDTPTGAKEYTIEYALVD